ncbi:MAG: SH3 domain-containing protein [Bacteroidaceae bacterium]|nr:SH3 domain-containing protein [Bacteroidaceae bacterium]
MNDKALFTLKLLFVLALIVGIACIALDAQADEWLAVKIVQARGGLNVRDQPGTEAKATYLLNDTETVLVLEWRDGWALVAKNTSPDMVLGWVSGDYLK